MARKLLELPVPPAALSDPKSREMIRAWIAKAGLHCSLNIGSWDRGVDSIDEIQAWSILLADIARHVSNALEEETGADARETVLLIRDYLNEEIDRPTSGHSGGFVD